MTNMFYNNYTDPIFKYLNPTNNDLLSCMNLTDLKELLIHLDNYYLQLRTTLNFTPDITFGLEIEAEDTSQVQIYDQLKLHNLWGTWDLKNDASLEFGVEINSPVLTDTPKNWQELDQICAILRPLSIINNNCGGHIHIGTQILGEKTTSWLQFIILWSTYENIIFRFLYGEYLTARTSLHQYAPPLAKTLTRDYKFLKRIWHLHPKTIIKKVDHTKNQAINFSYIDKLTEEDYCNTIEFRAPNGTLDPIIWQNNVNLLVSILNYSQNITFNLDLVTNRQKTIQPLLSNLAAYKQIYLEQALELADLLFNNNLDKIYFLKQYLKSFQTSNQPLTRAKSLTKTFP